MFNISFNEINISSVSIYTSVIIKILFVPGGFVAFFIISPNRALKSIKLIVPEGKVSNSKFYKNAVNLVSDYLPLPPTPTNKAWPLDLSKILEILVMCIIAYLNNTKFIWAFESLYSSNLSYNIFLSYSIDSIGKYKASVSPWIALINVVKIFESSKMDFIYSSFKLIYPSIND